jgi:hypothetical protein
MRTKILILLMLVALFIIPIVSAASAPLDTSISDSDKEKFNQILEPVMKIYKFVKYIASVVAGIFLLYSGITYMASGADMQKREQAKNIASYVIFGLVIIWASPLIVELLI